MSFWESPGGASLIGAGADILSGAFGGGDGMNTQRSQARKMLRQANAINRKNAELMAWNMPRAIVSGAKRAGLHPLVAMGINPAQGGSASVSIPGQSQSGSFAQDGLRAASRHFQRLAGYRAQKELVEAQAEASRARTAENLSSNDTAGGIDHLVNASLPPAAVRRSAARKYDDIVEVVPDPQVTRDSKDPSRSAATKPAWMQVEIWPGVLVDVPWSEEGFSESIDGLPQLAAVVARNSAIGYQKAYRLLRTKLNEFHRSKSRNMRSRHPDRFPIAPKVPRRRQTTPDIFIPYSRGPHR